jgi:hypothetical protein
MESYTRHIATNTSAAASGVAYTEKRRRDKFKLWFTVAHASPFSAADCVQMHVWGHNLMLLLWFDIKVKSRSDWFGRGSA